MPYTLRWYPQVKGQLRQVPDRIQADVIQAILDLRFDPYPPTGEPLRDQYASIRKLKIDGWRIFYEVDVPDRTVIVIAVKRRTPDTYRKMTAS